MTTLRPRLRERWRERSLMWTLALALTATGGCPANAPAPTAFPRDASVDDGSDAGIEVDGGAARPDSGPEDTGGVPPDAGPTRLTRTLEFNGVSVQAIIDRPAATVADALLLFHGTVIQDSLVLQAAQDTLDGFSAILDRDDMLVVSVAYPEEGLLMGDNLAHAEAALLWVKTRAAEELGVAADKVFLAGHSQGGYLVTRLNTLHEVAGVIANGPGPLDLVFRCRLEEDGEVPPGVTCGQLAAAYGSTRDAPEAYAARSLLAFTRGHRSDILFVQGLEDSPIQMRSWPLFKEQMETCPNCEERVFLELQGLGHNALFNSDEARRAFNQFLSRP